MRKIATNVEGHPMASRQNRPVRQHRRQLKRTPNRQVLNALLLQRYLDALQADLEHPEGLRSNSALLELARLAPSAARILSSIEELLETAPPTLRSELQEAHDSAWAALEYGIEEERRVA